MNFISTTVKGESLEAWEARVLLVYPNAHFYRYADNGRCAIASSPFQPDDWSPRWRVGQWSWVPSNGGHLHVPENLKLHLAALASREQAYAALIDAVHDQERHQELRALGLITNNPFAAICTRIRI